MRVAYWSVAREATTERVIDPQLVFTDRGYWYVVADDHRSGEQRTFRIDRLATVERSGTTFEGRAVVPPTTTGWFAEEGLARATLRLGPGARWIVERYPIDSATELPDGGVEVVLPVTGEAWLTRLLLRAGPEVSVVEPAEWQELGRATARRVLARYAG